MRWLLPTLGGVALVTMAAMPQSDGQAEAADAIDGTRAAYEKLAEARRLLGNERREWREYKVSLADQIELANDEIESMNESIAAVDAEIASSKAEYGKLLKAEEAFDTGVSGLTAKVSELEARVKLLLPSLPDPLRQKVQPVSQSLPDDSATTEMKLSKRLLTVTGILNEVNKFQADVFVQPESRELGNGTTGNVTAIYVGISKGYYVSADGQFAGVGQARDGVWTWEARNDAAAAIARAVAMYENKEQAAYIGLPLDVDPLEKSSEGEGGEGQ